MLTRLKLTPLSLMIAVCITYSAYLMLGLEKQSRGIGNGTKIAYTLALAVILFLTDLLFRRFIESKKWIWLIQGSFILIIVVLMIIFQKG